MSVLNDIRTGIVQALEAAGIQAFDHLPERLNPPVAVLVPGSPYLEAGDVFGTHKVRYTVALVAGNATNDMATKALDELIETAVTALWDTADLERAGDVYTYQANNGQYLAVDLEISDVIRIK
ncbi:hypothetical protein SAMN06309944_0164 [Micrococcales bacterium KH10]|nr:hypothetical protein SAMN06309944_0164 [Micrococcales bacterium KH10]